MIRRRGYDYDWIYTGSANMFEIGALTAAVRSTTSCTTGKKYAEILINTLLGTTYYEAFGIVSDAFATANIPGEQEGVAIRDFLSGARLYKDTSIIATNGPTLVDTDVINVAVDMTAGKVWLGINGTYYYDSGGTLTAGGNPATGANETSTFAYTTVFVGAGIFGAPFEAVTGFKATLRTQSSQFTGSIPSGFTAWYAG